MRARRLSHWTGRIAAVAAFGAVAIFGAQAAASGDVQLGDSSTKTGDVTQNSADDVSPDHVSWD
jgi:hypothetical protein